MRPISRTKLAGVSVLVAALTAAGCAGGADSSGGDDVVRVGLSAAFSGKVAYYGQDSKAGIELALDRLRTSMPNNRFELVTVDDECSPQGGASAFRRLTDVDQVDVILGSACSSGTLGGMPTLLRSKTPALTFGATNPKISQGAGAGRNPYMWRMNLDDSIMGRHWARYIAAAGFRKAAIIAANNDFGRGAADLYAGLLPEADVTLAATEYYDLGASDFRPQLTKVRGTGADVLVTFAEPPDCAQMLRQMHEMGLRIAMYGRGGCAMAEALDALGDPTLANGVREASYWAPTDTQRDLLDAYRAKTGKAVPPYLTALGYYGMLTVAEAVGAGGKDRAGIQRGLADVDFTTGIGPIRFDDHNQAHPNMFIVEVRQGAANVLETVATGR